MKTKTKYSLRAFIRNEILIPIKNEIKMFWDRRAFRKACRYADFLSEKHNDCRYVVMKNFDGSYISFNKEDFKLKQRRGQFVRKCTWAHIVRDAPYNTG